MSVTKPGYMTCHYCMHNAGVKNGFTKCLKKKKVIDRNGEPECDDYDGSDMPGKVLSLEQFNARIKQSNETRKR